MDVNKQKECEWFKENNKGFCIKGEKDGFGVRCLEKDLGCPYAWNWIERSNDIVLRTIVNR